MTDASIKDAQAIADALTNITRRSFPNCRWDVFGGGHDYNIRLVAETRNGSPKIVELPNEELKALVKPFWDMNVQPTSDSTASEIFATSIRIGPGKTSDPNYSSAYVDGLYHQTAQIDLQWLRTNSQKLQENIAKNMQALLTERRPEIIRLSFTQSANNTLAHLASAAARRVGVLLKEAFRQSR